jgi:ABC-type polysaccharide/polyol phosphate transport system ATPase subunit
MSSEPGVTPAALRLHRVSKRYHMQQGPMEVKTALLHPLRFLGRQRARAPFWAVRDVSLAIGQGEFFSIIGANGSGKSTLLRLMAGLSRPTDGTIEATGRISTLLELGSGFHPQVSGRENAVLNGLLIGMTRGQIEALLPGIVAFAGLQEFIDQPMRTYSSGMYVRLGFAIAAHMDPEVLLVDEVLAVGDLRFQEKCYDHIASLQARGVTIVMVSHDLAAVERFSTRAALMERGRIVAIGDPHRIVGHHIERLAQTSPEIRRAIEDAIEERPEEFARALEEAPEETRDAFRQAYAERQRLAATAEDKENE